MQLGTCKGGVEAEGSHCRKQGRLALVHPELAITRHLQAPKSMQAQDTAQGHPSVHGMLQARILEWAAMPSSRGSFPARDGIRLSCGSEGKASACNAGDLGSYPWVGKIPWKRKWQPTLVFLPG